MKNKIINYILILLFGIILGITSKYLDNIPANNIIISYLDLGNFFSNFSIWIFIGIVLSIFSKTPLSAGIKTFLFFIGMTISYHLYTIIVNGFNPKEYMIIWYTITIISPVLSYIINKYKDNNKISIIINTIIIFISLSCNFSIGMWYFDFKGLLYLVVFISTLVVIYKNIKDLSISLIIGLLLSFIIRIPFIE